MRVVLDARGIGDETPAFSVALEQPDVAATAQMRVNRDAPAVGGHVEASILAGCADGFDYVAGSIDPGQIQIAGLRLHAGYEAQRRYDRDERCSDVTQKAPRVLVHCRFASAWV